MLKMIFNVFLLLTEEQFHCILSISVESHASLCLFPISLLQLVESTFLWQLHDLRNNEAGASDGIRLNPPGLDSVLGVNRQQHAMHCDPIGGEIKPVCLIRILYLPSSNLFGSIFPTQIQIHPAFRTLQN